MLIELNAIKSRLLNVLDFNRNCLPLGSNLLYKLDRDAEECELNVLSGQFIGKFTQWISTVLLPKLSLLKKILEQDILCSDEYRNASKFTLTNSRESFFETFALLDTLQIRVCAIANLLSIAPFDLSSIPGLLSEL